MASDPNSIGAPTAAQRLRAAGLKPSSGRGVMFTDNGQEKEQAIDYRLSSCALRAGWSSWPRACPPLTRPPAALADDGEDGQQDESLIHCPTLRSELEPRCAAAAAACCRRCLPAAHQGCFC